MKFKMLLFSALACAALAGCMTVAPAATNITDSGAVADGKTVNTAAIQSAIDKLAADKGGTLVIPEGVFVSGALFMKPGVNLRLEKGAVLRCSTDVMANFPQQRTRIEGHFEEKFNPALINADGCDGLRISGEGTLDGAGLPVWEEFWTRRRASPAGSNFRNLDVARARLSLIQNSKNVTISGVTFKDSQFWNLHLYNCNGVVVEQAKFTVPDDYKQAPSSDGIDVDSCQNVTIRGCYFSVCDDCIGLKGTKGPFAKDDKSSPPVEHIRVSDCEFKRGHGMITCGSEATLVHDVVVENCRVTGAMPLVRLKLRPDTPQHYEDIHVRNITADNPGVRVFEIKKWSQYFDLMGQPEPESLVTNITVEGVTGSIGSLGVIEGNAKTTINNISLSNVDAKAADASLSVSDKVTGVVLKDVKLNGKAFELK